MVESRPFSLENSALGLEASFESMILCEAPVSMSGFALFATYGDVNK